MAQPCPTCGAALQPILIHGAGEPVRSVRCSIFLCPFNFRDQRCDECGGEVVEARHPELGRFEVTCAKGHTWNCH